VTGSQKHRDPRYLPYAFTEHGAIMAANVLNSPRATQMSVFVVRAFVRMRAAFKDSWELAQKLALLEQELKTRLDIHEAAIVDVLQRIIKVLDPPPPPPRAARAGNRVPCKRGCRSIPGSTQGREVICYEWNIAGAAVALRARHRQYQPGAILASGGCGRPAIIRLCRFRNRRPSPNPIRSPEVGSSECHNLRRGSSPR